jgi:CubicO group peptidase (beta-lactamase class C family)
VCCRVRPPAAQRLGPGIRDQGRQVAALDRHPELARTFGHFGASGTLLWVDPAADLALAVLTDRDFGDWCKPLWPALADAVLAESGVPG